MNLIPIVVADIDKLASRTVQTDSRNASGVLVATHSGGGDIGEREREGDETEGQVPLLKDCGAREVGVACGCHGLRGFRKQPRERSDE